MRERNCKCFKKSIVANKTLYEKHIIKNSDITFKRL